MRLSPRQSVANPFAMMLDPEQVVRAVEHSERLNRLHSRIYRPLDKPLVARTASSGSSAAAEFDRLIDASAEAEPDDAGGAAFGD